MSKARHYPIILKYIDIYKDLYIYMLPIYACRRQEFTFTHVRLTDSCNFSTKYFDLFCRLFWKTDTFGDSIKIEIELKLGVANAKQIVLMMRCFLDIFEIISNINKFRLKSKTMESSKLMWIYRGHLCGKNLCRKFGNFRKMSYIANIKNFWAKKIALQKAVNFLEHTLYLRSP